jgi:hypothetical protein
MSPHLTHSFAKNRGTRGVHFYDSANCEFFTWDKVFEVLKNTSFPPTFGDRLVDTVANYDPNKEFVAVSAGGGQVTIEIFRVETL